MNPNVTFPNSDQAARPNPWGGAGVPAPMPDGPGHSAPSQFNPHPGPQQQAAPEPTAPAPAAAGPQILELHCPGCNASLKLRREHVGVNGACIHCAAPIRAIPDSAGQIVIELLNPAQPEPPVIPVEAETLPATENGNAGSLWQQPQETSGPVASTQPEQPAFHAEPPAQNPTPQPQFQPDTASPINESTPVPPSPWGDSATTTPANQFGENKNPVPNQFPASGPEAQQPENTMPWSTPTASASVADQSDFEQFKARSPFEPTPGGNVVEQPQEATVVGQQEETATYSPNVSGGKQLSKPRRTINLRWLGWVAALVVVAALGACAYVFAPPEKLEQAKAWATGFLEPAFDAIRGSNDSQLVNPDVPNPETPEKPTGAPTTEEKAPASKVPAPAASLPVPEPPPVEEPPAPVSENKRVESAGTEVLTGFYAAPTLEDKLPFLLKPVESKQALEIFYADKTLPTKAAIILMRKQMRDSGSGRWFGLFEVMQEGIPTQDRWIVVENEEGEFKIDWAFYDQLASNALLRFFDDPTALPRRYRLSVSKGAAVPEDNNPWNSDAIGVLMQTPFDSQPARPIILKKSDYEGLGFGDKLDGGGSKIVRAEMSWVPSEYDPNSRVPVITRIFGWGMWE